MRLPKLLIIGSPRCGTSSMFNMLCQVPGIYGKIKEAHFFNRHFDKGLEYYAKQFAAAPKGDMLLEATPFYLADIATPERVKNTLPDVRLVALLRDPVARCLSHYWWNQDKFGSDPEVLIDSDHHCVEHGHYDEHLHRWAKFFPRKQMLIFASEAFFELPSAYAKHVATWAGISHKVAYGAKFERTYYDPLEWRKKKYGPVRVPDEVVRWLRLHYQSHNAWLDKMLAPYNITAYWRTR